MAEGEASLDPEGTGPIVEEHRGQLISQHWTQNFAKFYWLNISA